MRENICEIGEQVETIERQRREEILESVEILAKYEGYISRERETAERNLRLEYVKLPRPFDYMPVRALSTEARQKLQSLQPATIGQAARVPGVSPADVNVLLLLMKR